MTHYVYLLACSDERNSFYIGYTTDLSRRLRKHNAGEGAKYTRGRTPVRPRYVEFWDEKSEAMQREWELKQLSRQEKERLVPASSSEVRIELRSPETNA